MPTLTFWIDVDNTLIANDDIKADLDAHMQVELGPKLTAAFWGYYEEAREAEGVVDIPQALRSLRERTPLSELDEERFLHVQSIFDHYPFFKALYPEALETLHHLQSLGTTVIVSDGDQVYQAEKIFQSALAETVGGRVLLYIHKQEHLAEIMQRYPADHFVIIDDKPQILVDCKAQLGERLTTVFVKQGKYAMGSLPADLRPEISVEQIADLRTYSAAQFLHTHETAEEGS